MCFYLVEVVWPLWHRGLCLCVQTQAGWGCACLGIIPLSGSLMAYVALTHTTCPSARLPRLWCKVARGTEQWTIVRNSWRLRISIFTDLFLTFPAPDRCLWPRTPPGPGHWTGASAAAVELPRAHPAPRGRGSAAGTGNYMTLHAIGNQVKKYCCVSEYDLQAVCMYEVCMSSNCYFQQLSFQSFVQTWNVMQRSIGSSVTLDMFQHLPL